jgi:hypothetical protein
MSANSEIPDTSTSFFGHGGSTGASCILKKKVPSEIIVAQWSYLLGGQPFQRTLKLRLTHPFVSAVMAGPLGPCAFLKSAVRNDWCTVVTFAGGLLGVNHVCKKTEIPPHSRNYFFGRGGLSS